MGILLIGPAQLVAQGPGQRFGISSNPARPHPTAELTQTPRASKVGGKEAQMMLGGIVGAVVGSAVGAILAKTVVYGSADSCPDDDCGLATALRGAVIGEGIGFGVGSYLAGGREQNPLKRILIPTGVSAILLLVAEAKSDALPLAGILPVQLISIYF